LKARRNGIRYETASAFPVAGPSAIKREFTPFAVAPVSFTRLVEANPVRSLMIGFVRNENFVSLRMEPITKPPELPA